MTKEALKNHRTKSVSFTINGENGKGLVNETLDGFQLMELAPQAKGTMGYARMLILTDAMIESMNDHGGGIDLQYDGNSPWVVQH